MGRIAKILSFLRVNKNGINYSDVKVDMGGGYNITVKHLSNPGDDSYPLNSDYVLLVSTRGEGKHVAIAYADTVNTSKANEGDKRIYSRDSAGAMAAEVWLKNDGEILLSNGDGYIKLIPGGNIDLNGVIIDSSGKITSSADIITTADVKAGPTAIDVVTHTHIGSPSAAVGPVTPTGIPI